MVHIKLRSANKGCDNCGKTPWKTEKGRQRSQDAGIWWGAYLVEGQSTVYQSWYCSKCKGQLLDENGKPKPGVMRLDGRS